MQATVVGDPAGHWSSAEIILPAPQQYRAYLRMKTNNNTTLAEVARLEVINNQSGAVIGLHRLYGPDFRANGVYQEFHVDFDYATVICGSQGVPVTLRLTFQDTADVLLDRIIVVEYPTAYTSNPTYNQPDFRLKVIDGGGNVSGDLLVLSAPASFSPVNYKVYLPLILSCAGFN